MSRKQYIMSNGNAFLPSRSNSKEFCRATPIRILIINQNEIDRVGLRLILKQQRDFTIVSAEGHPLNWIQRCSELRPHVLLFDPIALGEEKIEIVEALHSLQPAIQIIALTATSNISSWSRQSCVRVRLAICVATHRSLSWCMPSGKHIAVFPL